MNKTHCSFCGKVYPYVKKIVAAKTIRVGDQEYTPGICNECIEACTRIIREEERR